MNIFKDLLLLVKHKRKKRCNTMEDL